MDPENIFNLSVIQKDENNNNTHFIGGSKDNLRSCI